MLTYATRSALLLRPLIQSTRATARALSATPYLDRTKQGPVWPTLATKPDEKTLEKDGKGVCAGSAPLLETGGADLSSPPRHDLYLPATTGAKTSWRRTPPNRRSSS